jgi:putative nucleotidyltransferase with HDIG domain
MSKGRILVIDPQTKTLARAISTLVDEGFEVVGAAADPEAIAKLQSGKCDLIILNTRLPRAHVDKERQEDSQPMAVVLLKPVGAESIVGIISGFGIKVISLGRVSEAMRQVIAQAQALREATRDEIVLPLAGAGESLATEEETSRLLSLATENLAKVTAADYVSVMLWDSQSGQLSTKSTFWLPGQPVPPEEIILHLAYPAVESRQPFLSLDGRSSTPEIQEKLVEGNIATAFSLPLKVKNQLYGVATFLRFKGSPAFSQFDVHSASIFGSTLALILENAQLYNRIRQEEVAVTEYQPQLERRLQEIRALNNLLQTQQTRLIELDEAHRSLKSQYLSTLRSLVTIMETGDPSGESHSETVARWVISLAESMGVTTDGLAELAYLHDITMFPIHPTVSGQELSPEEESRLKNHPISGEKVAENMGLPAVVRSAIRHHHENYDGSGYPDGLRGDKIPVGARLLRVVDDYVTMVSPGPGRKAFREDIALARIKAGANKEYDPVVVEAFLKLVGKREVRPEVEMVSTVSHELRSPLTYLVGYSELLASQEDLSPSAQQAAKEIYSEATHMARLVEDLLDISRFESGRLELRLTEVDLAEIVKRSIATAALKTSQHQLETVLHPDLPPVKADPDRIRQVLDNLLTNAINYSPEGGKITVRAVPLGNEVRVSVSDQGIGIPKDKQEMLFQKFYRVDSPLKSKVKGTGLGLSICKHIIEAHGGNIWVESEEGKGSTFYFTLPLWR